MEDAPVYCRSGIKFGSTVDCCVVKILAGFPVRVGADRSTACEIGIILHGTGIECGEFK